MYKRQIYAATRNELYRSGKKIEILVNFCPKLHYVSEWWKQLYGESEGKDNKGIFPASVDFSTDLHSMGQWIQEGERSIFETVISLDKVDHKLEVPFDEANLDGLNFLAGKRVDEVNKMAELGTQLAHVDGGVPNMRIVLPSLNEYNIGGLLYFDLARRYVQTGDITRRRVFVPFIGLGAGFGHYEFEGTGGADGFVIAAPRAQVGFNIALTDLIGIDIAYQYQMMIGNGFGWDVRAGGVDNVSNVMASFRVNF